MRIYPRVIHQITIDPETGGSFEFKVTDDQKNGVIIAVNGSYLNNHHEPDRTAHLALTYNELKALAQFFWDVSWNVGNCAAGDEDDE